MDNIPENQRYSLNEDKLGAQFENTPLENWTSELIGAVKQRNLHHGDLPRWQSALDALPELAITRVDLDHPHGVCVLTKEDVRADEKNNELATHELSEYPISEAAEKLEPALKGLKPWRKGPYRIAHVLVDTEWRSDWKWNRVHPHISDLKGRTVLDVGCGNGYHLWRMRSAGASLVLGIDPSILFSLQFKAVQRYVADERVSLLPLTMETMPPDMKVFDTVFSMGVLYHRQNPHSHLKELLGALKPGGELVLETLVSLGEDASTLDIKNRYARMRNIWTLPTVPMLARWMGESGFTNVRFVSIDITSRLEQRTTEWMPFESLTESLNPDNLSLTVEGLPRPRRAIMIADAPQKNALTHNV